jgi:hypothetical protein
LFVTLGQINQTQVAPPFSSSLRAAEKKLTLAETGLPKSCSLVLQVEVVRLERIPAKDCLQAVTITHTVRGNMLQKKRANNINQSGYQRAAALL